MTDNASAISPAEQRLRIRAQLLIQRSRVAEQLSAAAHGQGQYPRSATMRLLLRHPALTLRLLAGVVRLLRAR